MSISFFPEVIGAYNFEAQNGAYIWLEHTFGSRSIHFKSRMTLQQYNKKRISKIGVRLTFACYLVGPKKDG